MNDDREAIVIKFVFYVRAFMCVFMHVPASIPSNFNRIQWQENLMVSNKHHYVLNARMRDQSSGCIDIYDLFWYCFDYFVHVIYSSYST